MYNYFLKDIRNGKPVKNQFGKIFKMTFGRNLIMKGTFLLFKFRKKINRKKLNYTQSYHPSN